MIDGGPSRTSQLGQRRDLTRQESARRQPEPQPEPAPEQPRVTRPIEVRNTPPVREPKKRRTSLILTIIAIIAVVIIGAVMWKLFGSSDRAASAIDSSKHQVVILSNSQAYFGKLSVVDSNYFKLTDVWYIQTVTDEGMAATDSTDAAETKLVKRGGEVYGPEDTMMLSRSQVLSFENIKSDSEVAELIRNYKP